MRGLMAYPGNRAIFCSKLGEMLYHADATPIRSSQLFGSTSGVSAFRIGPCQGLALASWQGCFKALYPVSARSAELASHDSAGAHDGSASVGLRCVVLLLKITSRNYGAVEYRAVKMSTEYILLFWLQNQKFIPDSSLRAAAQQRTTAHWGFFGNPWERTLY